MLLPVNNKRTIIGMGGQNRKQFSQGFSILSTGDRPINDDLEVKLIAIRDIQAPERLRS